jgi:hypothetical protein
MRKVIPPTPSWSIFEVTVCILAISSLLPIVESIYQTDINNIDNPFVGKNYLFIAAFIINTSLCSIIVIMLICIKFYIHFKLKNNVLKRLGMKEVLDKLTRKNFYLWRNKECRKFLIDEAIKRSIGDKDVIWRY